MTKSEAFAKLARSKFRSQFKLTVDDIAYIERVGLETIRCHATDFVREKLAPAEPMNDGKQAPMRGHPIFKAMHGSAMCCRDCMEKWWKVARDRALSEAQQSKAVEFLMSWIDANWTNLIANTLCAQFISVLDEKGANMVKYLHLESKYRYLHLRCKHETAKKITELSESMQHRKCR